MVVRRNANTGATPYVNWKRTWKDTTPRSRIVTHKPRTNNAVSAQTLSVLGKMSELGRVMKKESTDRAATAVQGFLREHSLATIGQKAVQRMVIMFATISDCRSDLHLVIGKGMALNDRIFLYRNMARYQGRRGKLNERIYQIADRLSALDPVLARAA